MKIIGSSFPQVRVAIIALVKTNILFCYNGFSAKVLPYEIKN